MRGKSILMKEIVSQISLPIIRCPRIHSGDSQTILTNHSPMKKHLSILALVAIQLACSRSETSENKTTQPPTDGASSIVSDSIAATLPQNCQSVVETGKLGKADVYQESAKNIKVSLTLAQDASTLPTSDGCYFNNSVEVLATKKSGSQLFKHTLIKDDLTLFTKNDEAIKQSILRRATYKPTFNGQKYITLTLNLMDPTTKKATDYTVYMNYYGEIVKVK